MAKILVVDDEHDLLELVKFNLEVSGHEVLTADTGKKGLSLLAEKNPDMAILDVNLPDLIGFEILRKIRNNEKTGSLPVLMLTARGEEADVLVGFELGADDYVSKPFSPRELNARVRAILQRGRDQSESPKRLSFDGLDIDLDSQQVFVDGREVTMAPQEYKLLAFLVTHPRRVFPRESLLAHAWGADVVIDVRTVDVHIRRLRSRIERDPAHPALLETVRGAGYRFNPNKSRG